MSGTKDRNPRYGNDFTWNDNILHGCLLRVVDYFQCEREELFHECNILCNRQGYRSHENTFELGLEIVSRGFEAVRDSS